MTEIGARVGAVQKANKTTVWLFGYGNYTGNETPPNDKLEEMKGGDPSSNNQATIK